MQCLVIVFLDMEQLDLFGFPVEPVKQAKKKEPVTKAPAVTAPIAPEAEPAIRVETMAEEPPAIAAITPIPEPLPAQASPSSVLQPSKVLGKRGRKSFRDMDSEADLVEVPEESILQQKLYYSISEVAGWFKVNTSLLRFWENEFDILQPRKTRKGDRLFRVEDIKNLQLIYFLLRQRKFSIDGAKKYLKNNRKEADTQAQLVQSLTQFKSFLLELKANIAS